MGCSRNEIRLHLIKRAQSLVCARELKVAPNEELAASIKLLVGSIENLDLFRQFLCSSFDLLFQSGRILQDFLCHFIHNAGKHRKLIFYRDVRSRLVITCSKFFDILYKNGERLKQVSSECDKLIGRQQQQKKRKYKKDLSVLLCFSHQY